MKLNAVLRRGEFVKTAVCAASAFAIVTDAAPAVAIMQQTKAENFRAAMRKLWEDHITWTRLYIVSVAAGLPDKELTAGRLLQNQEDIGNAIKPYYGEGAGNQLTSLLRAHILGAAELLAAAKAGEQDKVKAASARWYANADEIAEFLSGANPSAWPIVDTKAQMKKHLDLTLTEATARLQARYAADIQAYDKVHEHILGLADILSAGIINQFPNKFG